MSKKRSKKAYRPGLEIKKIRTGSYDYHEPVMLERVIESLKIKPDGKYIDGTLGGGGHSEAILKRLSEKGKLFSFDKDPEAIERCREKFWGELAKGVDSRIEIYNDGFENARSVVGDRGEIDGALLDLGLSSRQLDSGSRGFSYRSDSELDMRFGTSGKSAAELLQAAKEEEIERILREYGEEPFARRIARRVVERRRAIIFKTSRDLANVVEECVPARSRLKSLSRVFQAVRIAVNDELVALSRALEEITDLLAPGGRIVVISYHSLEDRIVKRFFKERSAKFRNEDIASRAPTLKIISKKPITPDKEEILRNPRARSAKLRIAEKI